MIVRIAENSGFCFGVKRAINMALEASKKYNEIVTMGSIIHNPQMVKKLEEKGIKYVNSLSEIKNRPTIIRSHGIEKNILEKLKKIGINLINATCPYVSKTQQYAEQLSNKKYQMVILGNKSHPEIVALKSYISGNVIIVNSAKEITEEKFHKVAIVSQTTRNIEDLQELVKELLPKCEEMRVINTICNATRIRQSATLKLAKKSDLMIVIGGRNSSNTKMLAKISEDFIETHHIETEKEIDKKWLINKEKIGLTAGASTPDWIIVEVYNKIIKYIGNNQKTVNNVEDIPGFKEDGDDC